MVFKMLFIGILLTCSGCMPPPEEETPETPPIVVDEAPSDEVQVKAETGVGRHGRGYGGGMVTEPIRQYFRAQQQIQFILMEKAIRDFKTLQGRMPKSHDEFMKEIIQANAIRLPELPDGETYVYDPEQEELMVRRPQ